MALINQKAPCEVPDDWRNEISNARSTPEPFKSSPLPPYSLNTLSLLYNGLLPLSRGKIKDIMHLKRFCEPAAQVFYETLVAKETDSGESDLSDCDE
ncbi:hypothetical protein J6590_000377 [Homalodisca vitripennis]|nr:hypothetical protein J6590_000377 [Homalodisca vitripennis]